MQRRSAGGVRRHFTYANVMSTLAVFLVVAGGTAIAAGLGKNSVRSKQVKDEALKSKDLKDGKAVTGDDVVDNSLGGADINESQLKISQKESLPPSGPAGGDLTGDYPSPRLATNSVGAAQIAAAAVRAAELADGSVDSAAVIDDSLGQVDLGLNSVGGLEVASNSIQGDEVENRSLDAVDVSKASGTTSLDYSPIGAHSCSVRTVDAGTSVDGDTILTTPRDIFPTQLAISTEDSNVANLFRVNVCNVTAGAIDPPATNFSWIVFDN